MLLKTANGSGHLNHGLDVFMRRQAGHAATGVQDKTVLYGQSFGAGVLNFIDALELTGGTR